MDEYLDGTLSDVRKNAFEAHVRTCHRCARELAEQKKLIEMLCNFKHVRAPEGIRSAVLSQLSSEKDAKSRSAPGKGLFSLAGLRFAGQLAMLCIIVMIGLNIFLKEDLVRERIREGAIETETPVPSPEPQLPEVFPPVPPLETEEKPLIRPHRITLTPTPPLPWDVRYKVYEGDKKEVSEGSQSRIDTRRITPSGKAPTASPRYYVPRFSAREIKATKTSRISSRATRTPSRVTATPLSSKKDDTSTAKTRQTVRTLKSVPSFTTRNTLTATKRESSRMVSTVSSYETFLTPYLLKKYSAKIDTGKAAKEESGKGKTVSQQSGASLSASVLLPSGNTTRFIVDLKKIVQKRGYSVSYKTADSDTSGMKKVTLSFRKISSSSKR